MNAKSYSVLIYCVILFLGLSNRAVAQGMLKPKTIMLKSNMEKILGISSKRENPVPNVSIKYFVGITTSKANSQELTSRRQEQHEAYAEMAGKYGFTSISSVSFKASYTYTHTSMTSTVSTSMSSSELTSNQELTLDLGDIQPGKGVYVYQPVFSDGNVLANFSELVITDQPLSEINADIIIEGEIFELDTKNYYALQCLNNTAKTLAYYKGAHNIYMGDKWVLSDPENTSAEWRFEQCVWFIKPVYWIIHRDTGRLLSWYEGHDVYAGDPWVKDEADKIKSLSSLWEIYPARGITNAYYIQHFHKANKLLSWYEGAKIYAGDDWVKKDPEGYKKSNYSSVWMLTKMSPWR